MRKIESSENTSSATRLKLARRCEIAPKRLFDDEARLRGQARRAQSLDDGRKQRRRDGQVVRRAHCFAEGLLQRVERAALVVVAAHVVQSGQQPVERARIAPATGARNALPDMRAQLLGAPRRRGDTDHGHLELVAPAHRKERRKNLLVRQITGDTEQHQRVGRRGDANRFVVHLMTPASVRRRPPRRGHRIAAASPTARDWRNRLRRAK